MDGGFFFKRGDFAFFVMGWLGGWCVGREGESEGEEKVSFLNTLVLGWLLGMHLS